MGDWRNNSTEPQSDQGLGLGNAIKKIDDAMASINQQITPGPTAVTVSIPPSPAITPSFYPPTDGLRAALGNLQPQVNPIRQAALMAAAEMSSWPYDDDDREYFFKMLMDLEHYLLTGKAPEFKKKDD